MRAVLFVTGVYHVLQGALALVDPGTFFSEIGRYGLENSHYVGDNGAFVLAAGIVLLLAAGRPAWREPVLVLVAVWYGFHALNHAFDVDEARSDARGIFDTVALALGALAAAWLARAAARLEGASPARE